MPNEADTCRRYVVPKLQAAGWDNEPYRINEQVTFTDGRIVVVGRCGRRRPGKRADYVLCYRADFPIAVVEAKPDYATPGEGMQQAKEYAEILDLKFAYSTTGQGIVEFDYLTGIEREIDAFPTPEELWQRLTGRQPLTPEITAQLLTPYYDHSGKRPRYYQEIAINRAVRAVLAGNRRVLLTLATGTGKTFIILPDFLETLVEPLEPHGRTPPPENECISHCGPLATRIQFISGILCQIGRLYDGCIEKQGRIVASIISIRPVGSRCAYGGCWDNTAREASFSAQDTGEAFKGCSGHGRFPLRSISHGAVDERGVRRG